MPASWSCKRCGGYRSAHNEEGRCPEYRIPRSTLEEIIEYFEQRADADLDYSGYTANEEMKILVELRRVMGAPV